MSEDLHQKHFFKQPLVIVVLAFLLVVMPTFSVLLWTLTQSGGGGYKASSSAKDFQKIKEMTAFNLRTQKGKIFRKRDLYRHFVVVLFDDTSCDTDCTDRLKAMNALSEAFHDNIRSLVPVFITTKPKQDNVDVLNKFIQPFGSKIITLTGREHEIERAKLLFHASPPVKNALYLMGPGHKFLGVFPGAFSQQNLSNWINSFTKNINQL